jgi:hypothetical protein
LNPTNQTSAAFTFTATETATFECQMDGGGYTACSSPKNYALTAGSHTFMVRATDLAGNVDASPASYTWTIDTTTPDTSITGQPSNPTNSTSASFSFSSTTPGSTFQCQMDGGAYATCTNPKSYSSLSSNTTHTFKVRATDTAGNTDATPASYSWMIDTTAPTVAISAPSLTTANSSSGPVTYTVTYTGADAVTLANADIILNKTGIANGTVSVNGTGTGSRTITIFNITGYGTLGISIAANTASDTAGNIAAAVGPSTTFTVDNSYGDLNGDGIINMVDALKALQIAAGLHTPTPADLAIGDVAPVVNGRRQPDGIIDSADVVAILRKAVGLPSW